MNFIAKIVKNRVASNAAWIIACRVIQSALALIINIFTARYLGASNYGVINYAVSLVAFISPVMQLGLNSVLVQELTLSPEEEGKIVGTSICMSFFSAICCVAGLFLYTINVDAGELETNIVVVLYSLILLIQAVELMQYWFQKRLLTKYYSLVSLGAYICVSIYKIYLLVEQKNIYWFTASYLLDYGIIVISLLIIYNKIGGQKLSFSFSTAKKLFSTSKHYILSSMMVTIFAQTDKIMLKIMVGNEAVGYYSAAVACAGISSFVFVAIIDSLRPVIFECKKNNDGLGYEKNLSRLYSVIIYLSLIQSIVMTFAAKLIVGVLYGSKFAQSVLALQIIVWYTTFTYLGSVRNIWILGENKQKYLWIINLGGAVINIVLNWVMIPIWGIYGAATASLFTQFFTNVIMNYIVWPLRYNNRIMWKGLDVRLLKDLVKSIR